MAFSPLSVAILLVTTLSLFHHVNARTVHGSVIFMRTGERTPLSGGPGPVRLTSAGAQQAYSLGDSFRHRYIEQSDDRNVTYAPIYGLTPYSADPLEVTTLVPYGQCFSASASAFLQGLYPPTHSGGAQFNDTSSLMADGSVIQTPLDGYVYPLIRTSTDSDPSVRWVASSANCINSQDSAAQYSQTEEFYRIQNSSKELYGQIGNAVLTSEFGQDTWGYLNAYLIYDYVRYQYEHHSDVRNLFNDSYELNQLSQLRWLADEQQWALNGYEEASGNEEGDRIRTVAGQTLAAKIYFLLQNNIDTNGQANKINLMVGEFDTMVSLFSLLRLTNINPNFYGLPEYGSSLVFELFSADSSDGSDTGDNTPYPDSSDLWVNFYFRNGTSYGTGIESDAADDHSDYRAYPIFGRGPSETDMTWADFVSEMEQIMMGDVDDWCNTCGAVNPFCLGSSSSTPVEGPTSSASDSSSSNMTPQVAGVIGAAVTLGVVLLAMLLASLLGIRFTRHASVFGRKSSDLGGFKGSAKLASDQDLSLPKSGAPMAGAGAGAPVVVGAAPAKGHERVGSWELREPTSPLSLSETLGKDIEAGLHLPKVSLEDETDANSKPVQPHTSF